MDETRARNHFYDGQIIATIIYEKKTVDRERERESIRRDSVQVETTFTDAMNDTREFGFQLREIDLIDE